MPKTIAKMTPGELQALIEDSIEQKLAQVLADPDRGLRLKKAVRARLTRQMRAVAKGERGQPLSEVARKLRLG